MTLSEIRTAAMELNPAERETLAEELVVSVSEAVWEKNGDVWLAEVRRRDAEAVSSRMPDRNAFEALADLRQRIEK